MKEKKVVSYTELAIVQASRIVQASLLGLLGVVAVTVGARVLPKILAPPKKKS